MRSKLALETVLALLILGVLINCQEVRAIELTPALRGIIDPHSDDFGPSFNIQPVEEYPHNLTLHTYHGFKNKFLVDYSAVSPDTGGRIPSDATGMIRSATSTIPEFPSILVLLLFMIATVLGVIVFRTKHAI
ncbi:MAG: hypothetical protein ABSF24_06960 [Candidatus Bathyarchaeia archaeon]|jgi:hypothetical protein